MRTTVLLLLLLINTPLFADYPLEIIELKGRTPDEVIPILRPHLANGDSISGMNNQLFLRTSPENLHEIRALLSRIDIPPRRLLLSVRQSQQRFSRSEETSHAIDTPIGGHVNEFIERPVEERDIRLRSLKADSEDQLAQTSAIQTIEGSPAFIAIGRSLPVTRYRRFRARDYRDYQNQAEARSISTGFYALPRVNGEHVTVRITPLMEFPGRTPGSFELMHASTLVTGELGQWIRLGGAEEGQSRQQSGLSFYTESDRGRVETLWLMVEEIR